MSASERGLERDHTSRCQFHPGSGDGSRTLGRGLGKVLPIFPRGVMTELRKKVIFQEKELSPVMQDPARTFLGRISRDTAHFYAHLQAPKSVPIL